MYLMIAWNTGRPLCVQYTDDGGGVCGAVVVVFYRKEKEMGGEA